MASKPLLTREEFRQLFIDELAGADTPLTDDNEGSIVDIVSGVAAEMASEVAQLIVEEFGKTFFGTAEGPETTGGTDYLEVLAVDHFGPAFARPAAQKATGEVTFSRANDDAGAVTIAAGTVVETAANANGETTRFVTTAEVELDADDLTVIAQVEAEDAGTGGNVAPTTVNRVVTTLTDATITVSNVASMTGGTNQETTAQYRETIRSLLNSLKGATLLALESAALAVAGVSTATAIEKMIPVIQYDIGGSAIEPGAEFFRIPYAYIYIAGPNGTASDALVSSVQLDIDSKRAAGVKVEVVGADAIALNWSASYTLDPGGPNFATLSSDSSQISDSMEQYIADLPIGTDFVRVTAEAAILAIWGPAGTGDLTAFETVAPVGDVSVDENQKLVAGDVEIV